MMIMIASKKAENINRSAAVGAEREKKNSDANSARRLLTGHSKITMLPPIVETTINFFYSAVYYIAIFQHPLSVHLLNVTAAINSSFVL